MNDDELDLNAFIANIEQSAPQEDIDDKQLRCRECDVALEEQDGLFVCPNCSAQATNILQLEETEFNYDEMGRAIVGQQVKLHPTARGHQADYGWSWSTDEAIVHLLNLQLAHLEQANLVPESFCQRVKIMWLRFWVGNIAPFIKDVYDENDLKPIDLKANPSLRMRDIEVLVKVQDKVMIPERSGPKPDDYPKKRLRYRMMGAGFIRKASQINKDHDNNYQTLDHSSSDEDQSSASEHEEMEQDPLDESTLVLQVANQINTQPTPKLITNNVSIDNISILTLNRALAFIEAAARCTDLNPPIFASDLIRACNCRLIPFYGAHKSLPDHMRLNHKDKKIFSKVRPPSPQQLTRTASVLLAKIYHDKLPKHIPVPNLEKIFERFVVDMNLPQDLLNHLKVQPDFTCFSQTQPIRLNVTKRGLVRSLPQYDRWAYAILISHLKRIFSLDDQSIQEQDALAKATVSPPEHPVFSMRDWMLHTAMKLNLIFTHDPFVLFHPMAEIETLKLTPQVCNYIEDILHDKVTSTTRHRATRLKHDLQFHLELADFLKKEIPRPIKVENNDELDLERPLDIRYPLQDAFQRTKRFWMPSMRADSEDLNLINMNFSKHKTVPFEPWRKWSIYDNGLPNDLKLIVNPSWPSCYKILLSVGGYLCNCEAKELLREISVVEEYMFPIMKVTKKMHKAKVRSQSKRYVL